MKIYIILNPFNRRVDLIPENQFNQPMMKNIQWKNIQFKNIRFKNIQKKSSILYILLSFIKKKYKNMIMK